jgi:hypothetical protein
MKYPGVGYNDMKYENGSTAGALAGPWHAFLCFDEVLDVGFGRSVVSERDAQNILAKLV